MMTRLLSSTDTKIFPAIRAIRAPSEKSIRFEGLRRTDGKPNRAPIRATVAGQSSDVHSLRGNRNFSQPRTQTALLGNEASLALTLPMPGAPPQHTVAQGSALAASPTGIS